MGNYSWVFVALIALFSSSAFADYYWTISGTGGKWPSAVAACQAVYPRFKRVDMAANGRSAQCVYRYGDNDDRDYLYTSTYRNGTACTAPKTYNSATGACDDPPPDPGCGGKAGTSGPFSKGGTAPDGYMVIVAGRGAQKQSGCFNGCVANTADQKCKTKTNGVYLCKGTAWYTGESCASEPPVDSSDNSDPPAIESKDDSKPCIYSASGDKQVCTSTKTSDKDGQSCGTVNGVPKCISTNPSSDTNTVTTEVSSTTNPDGSKNTTKTDTATRTQCSGMLDCKSGTTTSTTNTSTDANGNVTGSTSTCKGSSCADKNTNPDGDGDGLGDCIENCGEGQGGAGDWYKPGEDTYESVITDFANKVKSVPAVSGVSGFLSYSPTGACPRYSVNVWVFHVQLDQWCTANFPWQLIAAVIIGTAAFFGFRIAFL